MRRQIEFTNALGSSPGEQMVYSHGSEKSLPGEVERR